jgi:hypothetical protein
MGSDRNDCGKQACGGREPGEKGSRCLCAAALAACPLAASAQAFSFSLNLEPGGALRGRQGTALHLPGAASLEALLGVGRYIDSSFGAGLVGLPDLSDSNSPMSGMASTVGVGLRVKRPHDGRSFGGALPWVDAEAPSGHGLPGRSRAQHLAWGRSCAISRSSRRTAPAPQARAGRPVRGRRLRGGLRCRACAVTVRCDDRQFKAYPLDRVSDWHTTRGFLSGRGVDGFGRRRGGLPPRARARPRRRGDDQRARLGRRGRDPLRARGPPTPVPAPRPPSPAGVETRRRRGDDARAGLA